MNKLIGMILLMVVFILNFTVLGYSNDEIKKYTKIYQETFKQKNSIQKQLDMIEGIITYLSEVEAKAKAKKVTEANVKANTKE